MKKLIVLPGNSIKNRVWNEGIASHFGGLFDAVYAQSYEHWETGEEAIDFDKEAEKLRESVALDKETEHYVFAKSFGTLLTFMSVHRGYIHPVKCVLFGVPLNLAEDQNIFKGDTSSVETFAIPAIAIHNEDDPVADYERTAAKLQAVTAIKVVPVPGDTHSYMDYAAHDTLIKDFLAL